MENTKIKVLIADDMEAHRRRLNRIISAQPDMEVAGLAESGYEAVLLSATRRPDIILMDIEMESKTAGIQSAQQINQNLPDIKIIMLTAHQDESLIFQSYQSGIMDYIIKTASNEEIIAGIRHAYDGTSPIRGEIAQIIRNEFKRLRNNESSVLYVINNIAQLTASELEVLKLFCQHKTKKEIAQERMVEFDTVKKQTTSILKKFHKETMSEVVSLIKELNLLDYL